MREIKASGDIRKLLYVFHTKDGEILMWWKWSRNVCGRHSWTKLADSVYKCTRG